MAIMLDVNGDDVNDDGNDKLGAMMHMTMVVLVMTMRICLTRRRGGVGLRSGHLSSLQARKHAGLQALRPINHASLKALKPSSPQTLKPSSPQA